MENTKPIRLLRARSVEQMTSLSRTEIYNRVKNGTFPKPMILGPRARAWVATDIENWILSLAKKEDK